MLRKAGLCMAFSLLCVCAYAQEGYIRIDVPKDKQAVGDLADVEGKVSDPKAKVWVIVRPKGSREFYVQPEVVVGRSGGWSCMAYIGRRGQDFLKQFQIRAVANPEVDLSEGKVLSSWPPAELSSEVITVVKSEQAG